MASECQRIKFDKKDFIRTENKGEADLKKFLIGYGIWKCMNIQHIPTRNIFQMKIVTRKHLLFDKT